MPKTFTPQSLVEFLYHDAESQYDDEILNQIFADDYLLSLFEKEADKMLMKLGRCCEPSRKSLLMIEQMAAKKIIDSKKFGNTIFAS